MSEALPPIDLDLLCAPLIRGESRPERLLALVEEVVGQRLGVEFTPYGELREVGERGDLLDRAFFGQLWADRKLMLVEGKEQSFCASLSGSVRSEGATPDAVTHGQFHMGILVPTDLHATEAMALMRALVREGSVYVGYLGSHVVGQEGIGQYAFRDLWPRKCTLSWINAWSEPYAEHLEFPGADDREHIWHIERCSTTGAWICALTEERLDPARADHAAIVSWARQRFCQIDQS